MKNDSRGAMKRIKRADLMDKVMTAEEAAYKIKDGMTIGISGFTSSGYPKAVPLELARQAMSGEEKKITLLSGASVGPEVDAELTRANVIQRRFPYQTNSDLRRAINDGVIDYIDAHLSASGQHVAQGVYGDLDLAIVEAVGIKEDGGIIPTTSVGNAAIYVGRANRVIVEVNTFFPEEMEGFADIFIPPLPPKGQPIPIESAGDRIGKPYIECAPEKIAAIVITNLPDKTRPFSEPDEVSERISQHIMDFFSKEIREGRLPKSLLPLQSGVGSVANAVLYGLCNSDHEGLTCYTEVVQDSMLALIDSGKAEMVSTTAISPSPERLEGFLKNIDFYRDKIILRPQEISNSPEVVHRLGVIAMNTALELDIYGNVNSTHVLGTDIINGIGGSGDFSRNSHLTIFSTPSTAKDGAVSSIVPMVSHVDHTEHDVMVVVTEQGLADLRGLSPRERAKAIITNCAHPKYAELLMDYHERACREIGGHTPQMLEEALSWHINYRKHGQMLSKIK